MGVEAGRAAASAAAEERGYGELRPWSREMWPYRTHFGGGALSHVPPNPTLFRKAMLKKGISCREVGFESRSVNLEVQGSCSLS